MIIMGAGICQWFHGDATYRAVLALLLLTGSMGRNGGGWAHYVGQEKCRPVTGWATMAMATDWQRPPRQMIGTAYWYTHTDQWRYDGYRADALTSPLAQGPPRRHAHHGHHRAVRAAGLDAVLPAVRPQPPRRRRRRRGGRAGGAGLRRRAVARRDARVRDRGSGRAAELAALPHAVAGEPARLLGEGRRVLPQAPARNPQQPDGRPDAARPPTPRRRLARRGPTRGQARPAAVAGLPDDQLHAAVRRRAPGRDLVREARPQHHRHASVRARVQPGDRPTLRVAHRLRRLPRHRPPVQRAGPHPPRRAPRRRRRAAAARHARRDGAARWPGPGLAGR